MDYGFVRVGAAVPEVRVANCDFNAQVIIKMMKEASQKGVEILLFPELSLSSYTCADLFYQSRLLEECEIQLKKILNETENINTVAIVGLPILSDSQLFNCAAVIQKGKILGMVPKAYIPGYSEFYEERWFATGFKLKSSEISYCGQTVPFGMDLLFKDKEKVCFGIEICEDIWVPIPPSCYLAMEGAQIIFNLSASNEVVGKYEYRKNIITQQSGRCFVAYVYASSSVTESTTDVVFGGDSLIAESGSLLKEGVRFKRESYMIYQDVDVKRLKYGRLQNTSFMEGSSNNKYRKINFELSGENKKRLERFIDPHPFVPTNPASRDERCKEIFEIQTAGLAKRMEHTKAKCAVIGVSGGLDSTLALLVIVKAFDLIGMDRSKIIAVTMPGFGTTDKTYNNALEFMRNMGVQIRDIDIKAACLQHFKDIGHDPKVHDVTYENVQARERTQIIMDIANKEGGFVVGTGDMSELALGWATYNGDHMSMYAVNTGVPKTLVKSLVQWVADNVLEKESSKVLYSILETPISPELLPPDESGNINQKTEDLVGPYELHDFFLYHMLRYGAEPKKIFYLANRAFEGIYESEIIKKWLTTFIKRFFSQQFKRSCLPDGPKVGTISLSPRGDLRMPSDAEANIWLKQLDEM